MANVIPNTPVPVSERDVTLKQPTIAVVGQGITATGETKQPVDAADLYDDPENKQQRQKPVPKFDPKLMQLVNNPILPSNQSSEVLLLDGNQLIDTSDLPKPWLSTAWPLKTYLKYSHADHVAFEQMRGEPLSPGAFFQLRRSITRNEMEKIKRQVELAKIERDLTQAANEAKTLDARIKLDKEKEKLEKEKEKNKGDTMLTIEGVSITSSEDLRREREHDRRTRGHSDKREKDKKRKDKGSSPSIDPTIEITPPPSEFGSEKSETIPLDAKYIKPPSVFIESGIRHRTLKVGFSLSKTEAAYLADRYPGYHLKIISDNPHPHPITAVVRNIAEHAAYRLCDEIADPYPSTKIWNINGTPNRFETRGITNIHTCHDVKTAYDKFKESGFVDDPTGRIWCANKWQTCFCNEFSVALLLYTAQDLGPKQLLAILDRVTSGTAIVIDHTFAGAKGLLHNEETKYYVDMQANMHVIVEGNEHEYIFKNNLWLHDGYYSDDVNAMCWGKVENYTDFCVYKFVKCPTGMNKAPLYKLSFEEGMRVSNRICELENPYASHTQATPLNTYLTLFEVVPIPTSKVYSYFSTILVLNYGEMKPLIIPKKLLDELSTKIIHMPRINEKGVAFDSLRGAALSIVNKHLMTPEEKKDFLTYGLPYAFAMNVKNEVEAFHTHVTSNETILRHQADLLKFVPTGWFANFQINVISTYFMTHFMVAVALVYTFWRMALLYVTIEKKGGRGARMLKRFLFGGSNDKTLSTFNIARIIHRIWLFIVFWYRRAFMIKGSLVKMPDICCQEIPLEPMRTGAKVMFDYLPECKEHIISKMIIGVKCRPVVYPRNCTHNGLLAIQNRFLLKEKNLTKDTDDHFWDFRSFVHKYFFQIILEGDPIVKIPSITLTNHEAYFIKWNSKYTFKKRLENMKAYYEIMKNGRPAKMKRLKQSFVKMETHSASDGFQVQQFVPRPIQPSPIQYQVQLGPVNAEILEWCKNVFNTGIDRVTGEIKLRKPHIVMGCNLDIYDMGKLSQYAYDNGFRKKYEGDCNRMDGHQDIELNKVVIEVYEMLGVDQHYVTIMGEQYSLAGIMCRVIWYLRNGGMNSGSPETYVANTILMICLYLYALSHCARRQKNPKLAQDVMAFISGDDLDSFSKHIISTEIFNKKFADVCMDIELKEVERDTFCQMVPYSVGPNVVYGPKPGRVLARTFWLHPKHGDYFTEKFDAMLHARSIALGLINVANHVPILRAVLQTIISKTEGLVAIETPYYEKYKIGSPHKCHATIDTLMEFSARYNIEIPDIIAAEMWIRENLRLGAFLEHPTIDIVVKQDLPMKNKPKMIVGEQYLKNWPAPTLSILTDIMYWYAKQCPTAITPEDLGSAYRELKVQEEQGLIEQIKEFRDDLYKICPFKSLLTIKIDPKYWLPREKMLRVFAAIENEPIPKDIPILGPMFKLQQLKYGVTKAFKMIQNVPSQITTSVIEKIQIIKKLDAPYKVRKNMVLDSKTMIELFTTHPVITTILDKIDIVDNPEVEVPVMNVLTKSINLALDGANRIKIGIKMFWDGYVPPESTIPYTVDTIKEATIESYGKMVAACDWIQHADKDGIVGVAGEAANRGKDFVADNIAGIVPRIARASTQEDMTHTGLGNFIGNRLRVLISNTTLLFKTSEATLTWSQVISMVLGQAIIWPYIEEKLKRLHWSVPHIIGIIEFPRTGFLGWMTHVILSKLPMKVAYPLHAVINLLVLTFLDVNKTLCLVRSPISSSILFTIPIVYLAYQMSNEKKNQSKASEFEKLTKLGELINQRIAERAPETRRGRADDRDVSRPVYPTRPGKNAPGHETVPNQRSKSAERPRSSRRSKSRSRSRGRSANGRKYFAKRRNGRRRQFRYGNRSLPSRAVVTPPPLPPKTIYPKIGPKEVSFAPKSALKRTDDVSVFTKRELSSTSIVNRQGQDSIIEKDIQIVLPNDVYCASTDVRGQVYSVLPITPALLAPQTRIELDAKEYDKFEVIDIRFGYQSVVGNNQTGAILLVFDPDATDPTEVTGFTLNLQSATDTRVKKVIQVQGNPDEDNWTPKIKMQQGEPAMFTSTTSGHTTAETTYGALIIACDTPTASSNTLMGQIVVRMTLRFFDHYNEGQQDMFIQEAAAPVSTSSLFAVTNSKYGWMINFVSALANTITYSSVGRFFLLVYYGSTVADTNTLTVVAPPGATATSYSTVLGHNGTTGSLIFVTFDLAGTVSRITPVTLTINGVANAAGQVKCFTCRLDGGNVPDTLAELQANIDERVTSLEKKLAKLTGSVYLEYNHDAHSYCGYTAYAKVIAKYGIDEVITMDDKTIRWAMREFIPRDQVLPGQTYDEIYDYKIKFALKNGADTSGYSKPTTAVWKNSLETQNTTLGDIDKKTLLSNLKDEMGGGNKLPIPSDNNVKLTKFDSNKAKTTTTRGSYG